MKNNGSMNRLFRVIWNAATGAWQAVTEIAKGQGKSKSAKRLRPALVAGAFVVMSAAAYAQTLPTGGTVVGGSATISQSGSSMTINQATARMAANWQSFSIGAGSTVTFNQPSASSVALNRVVGADVSVIQGALRANGQVFLLNPNGVLFTPTAQVDVGGIVASTLSLSTADFMAGSYQFAGSSSNAIVNQGNITTVNGGTIALIAAKITNNGTLTANGGNVLLGAGSQVTLDLGGPVKLQVTQGAIDALIQNGGAIKADGGLVYLTAKAAGELTSTVINNTGVIEAQTLASGEKGAIYLMGGMVNDRIVVGGKLDASAPHGGDGGFIETSAAHVKIADDVKVTTAAANGKTGTWLIDPVDFTIAASSGDITGAALGSLLASNSITIQTATGTNTATNLYGSTGTNGDIHVNDAVSWSANNTLTLNAFRNININQSITATTGKLALLYGQGAVAASNTATYNVNAAVNLSAGANFSTRLGSDGTTKNYTVITTATDLQGMNGGLSTNYALGSNIDAGATSTWNSNAGFVPIGNSSTIFTGTFDGLGHTISNLTINRPATDYVGLFGYAGSGAVIQNVGLVGGSVTGAALVGGLVGFIDGATISNSYATGSVSGTDYYVGGLVGYNNGTISNSYATGNVSGVGILGGLAGENAGTISNSYATGSVSGSDYGVGGLVGFNTGTISNSYATGNVSGSGSYAVGGLVGYNEVATISNSYWNTTNNVGRLGVGFGTAGGVTGLTSTQMKQQSNFSGFDFTNTWIGYDGYTNPLLRSFMTPLTVTANNIIKTYDGQSTSGTGISYSSTPNSNLLGELNYGGATAVGTYSPSGLYSNQQGYIISYVNGTLTTGKANAVVTANSDTSKVYTGLAQNVSGFSATGLVNGETASVLSGVSAPGISGTNAGSYTATAGVGNYSGNYNLSFVNGALTIAKANAVVTANSDTSKVYTGLAQNVSGFSATGLVNGETASVLSGVSASGSGTNAGSYNVVASGTDSNYNLTLNDGTLTINPAALTINPAAPQIAAIQLAQSLASSPVIAAVQPVYGAPAAFAPTVPAPSSGGGDSTRSFASGGLNFVFSSAPQAAGASSSASTQEGANSDPRSPDGATFAQAGIDPAGFMRVFVVGGGVRLPEESRR